MTSFLSYQCYGFPKRSLKMQVNLKRSFNNAQESETVVIRQLIGKPSVAAFLEQLIERVGILLKWKGFHIFCCHLTFLSADCCQSLLTFLIITLGAELYFRLMS